MTDNPTLGQRVAQVMREYGEVSDPTKPHLLTIHLGDLEAIVDEYLEWWLINVYDVPDPKLDE